MSREAANRTDANVEAAIARVLACERDAREAIAQARLDAEQIAESGRAAARALAERTELRIRAIRAAFERRLSAELAALLAADDEIPAEAGLSITDVVQLERAVTALAAELTGAAR